MGVRTLAARETLSVRAQKEGGQGMANPARNNDPVDSGFDFSRFLDLDDEDSNLEGSASAEAPDYRSLPYRRSEIVTGALESDLEVEIEGYIKAGKVPWGAKKSLRKLAAENSTLESTLRATDGAILERADGYDEIVSGILREKDRISEGSFLDDSDPYDAKPVGLDSSAPGSRDARIRSSELFKEIEDLEQHRSELNGRRVEILNEIRIAVDSQHNDSWELVDGIAKEKLAAINSVEDITKVDFSEEDEEDFDRGVDELQSYIQGNFDPLAEEDEYDEDMPRFVQEEPLAELGHTEQEILAMEEASRREDETRSFAELFGADETDEPNDGFLTVPEHNLEEFSSEESPEDLESALGEGFDAQGDDGTGEDDVLSSEDGSDSVSLATQPVDTVELLGAGGLDEEEFLENEEDERLEADLSPEVPSIEEPDESDSFMSEDSTSSESEVDSVPSETEFLSESEAELAAAEDDSEEYTSEDFAGWSYEGSEAELDEEIAADSEDISGSFSADEELTSEDASDFSYATGGDYASPEDGDDWTGTQDTEAFDDSADEPRELAFAGTPIFDSLRSKYGIDF